MTLAELAFACFCYQRMTDYDGSYLLLRQATQPFIDLGNQAHRQALLIWLNQWGCRQFAVEYHEHAAQELLQWHIKFNPLMFPQERNIWELNEADYQFIGTAYHSLANRIASFRNRNGNKIPVSVGPTGAAKILFAIRPNVCAPWDDPIRDSLQFDGSANSYVAFLRQVNQQLQEIRPTCEANGFTLAELPDRLDRNQSSVPKLIDEYYWMTITKNWTPPQPNVFQSWAAWCN
jgi:hypothetical protein